MVEVEVGQVRGGGGGGGDVLVSPQAQPGRTDEEAKKGYHHIEHKEQQGQPPLGGWLGQGCSRWSSERGRGFFFLWMDIFLNCGVIPRLFCRDGTPCK